MELPQIIEYIKVLEKRTEELNVRLQRVENELFPKEEVENEDETEPTKDG